MSGSTVGGGSVDWSLTSCPDILDHGQFSAPCPPQFQDPGVSWHMADSGEAVDADLTVESYDLETTVWHL